MTRKSFGRFVFAMEYAETLTGYEAFFDEMQPGAVLLSHLFC